MEKLARELEEKRQQQELERLREEEEMKKKSKRWKREISKEKDEPSGKKSQLGSKQVHSYINKDPYLYLRDLICCIVPITGTTEHHSNWKFSHSDIAVPRD